MTPEEKVILVSLLNKAENENLLRIYTSNDIPYYLDWAWLGTRFNSTTAESTINIKLK